MTIVGQAGRTMWESVRPHFFWFVVVAVGMVGFRTWVAEHDARMLAEQTIKQSEGQVKLLQAQNSSLEGQVRDTDARAERAISALQAAAARVKTPAQAVAAIPDVSSLPLRTQALPDGRVSVDALNLYQELNTCKQNETELAQCKQAREFEEQVIKNDVAQFAAKDAEIKAIKQKPKFWGRIKRGAELIGIGIGIGIVIASHP